MYWTLTIAALANENPGDQENWEILAPASFPQKFNGNKNEGKNTCD